MVAAKVARHAIRLHAARDRELGIAILNVPDYPFFSEFEGEKYLRAKGRMKWCNKDLQNFTPLRFEPPKAMKFSGKAVLIDPDVFACADIWELLLKNMNGKAILARKDPRATGSGGRLSSVMLLDCSKLRHWDCEGGFREMFANARDYQDWVTLRLEDQDTIGPLEPEWNSLDCLDSNTKLLHNTDRRKQPWKTGLRADWRPVESTPSFPPLGWLRIARRAMFGDYNFRRRYKRHHDERQEANFFQLLADCIDCGCIDAEEVRDEIGAGHLRSDAQLCLDRHKSTSGRLVMDHTSSDCLG